MEVCIVGWYGTETIGDRAIIAGIYSLLSKSFNSININLGSLYPFYSKRMLSEDQDLLDLILDKKINITIFNSRKREELDEVIEKSDFVIMGGGPIMHISELHMVEYAIKNAKRKGKKTGIIGCGIGPIFVDEFKKSTINIINNSDIVILRDEKSKENLINIFSEFNEKLDSNRIKVSFDPAVECALCYMEKANLMEKQETKEIMINLRDFPIEYSNDGDGKDINLMLEKFILDVSNKFANDIIRLIPMHYFHIGNDDRVFLNSIKLKNNLNNVVVQNEILSLKDTMDKFISAKFNVGMRFHSVVLQTILSGKNFILDYTEPNKGKISGFISDIDKDNFYDTRFVSLQQINEISPEILNESKIKQEFLYDTAEIKNNLEIYLDELRKIKDSKDV